MYRKMVAALVIVCVLGFSVCSLAPAAAAENLSAEGQIKAGKGLIGTYYNDDNFEEAETGTIDLLSTIDHNWGRNRGSDWAARWHGLIAGPITGEVTFVAEVQDGIHLTIGNTVIIDSLEQGGIFTGKVNMTRGQKAPIKLEFVSSNKNALLRLSWQWASKEKEIIPASALSHGTDELPKDFMVFDYNNRPSKKDDSDSGASQELAKQKILSGEGLIGNYYNDDDFGEKEVGMIDLLLTINHKWGGDRGSDWSAHWQGFVEGPTTGEVTFSALAQDGIRLTIGNAAIIDSLKQGGFFTGKANMIRGQKTPIDVEFVSSNKNALLQLHWQWAGKEKEIIPAAALSHSTKGLSKDFMVFDFDNRPSELDSGDSGDEEPETLDFLPQFSGAAPPYADTDYLDGRLRPVVGAHNFEVMRCNRTHPELATEKVPSYPDAGFENIGFTYNHQPTICYWQNKFWVIYESGPAHEHQPPCYALITWSEDGKNWHMPQTVFPAKKFNNKKEDNEPQYSLSHQRMNWYVTSDGRLIATGFHGMHDSPNDGRGVGRVAREIKGPGNYGPIYWVRYNEYQGYNKDNSPHYPFYKEAPDKSFVKAIDELLANKLVVQQWYEEDGDKDSGFFALSGYRTRFLKAFAWYHLPDNRIVGMWKWKKMVVADKWETGHISKQGHGKDIYYGGAKIWGEKMSDGKYALIYNPIKNTRWRHPLSITTGDDGLSFDTYFLNVQSETPLMRFGGANKDGGGAQYVRGIIPGNGTPPDGAIWLTYSSNKEDIRVTRVPVPIRGTVDKDVNDDFENMKAGGLVTNWNIYAGLWQQIDVVKEKQNKLLRLQDKAPYDYAKAVRVFPETTKAKISFDLKVQKPGRDALEIELQNYKGQRPVRIVIDGKNGLVETGKWANVVLDVDTTAGKYDLTIDGRRIASGKTFAEAIDNTGNPYKSNSSTPTIERIVFRTGTWRMKDFSRYGFGANDYRKNEPDLSGADEAVDNAVYDIDNVKTNCLKP